MEKEVDDTRLPRKEKKVSKIHGEFTSIPCFPQGWCLNCLYHVYIDLETSTIQIRIGGKFLPPKVHEVFWMLTHTCGDLRNRVLAATRETRVSQKVLLMHRSNRNFKTPQSPGQTSGIWLLKIGSFKFPSHWAKMRSEERRVGKECRSRWSPYH